MPTPTLTPGDNKQDDKLNPGQRDYDRRFNDLVGAEKRGTADMSDFERNYGENADSSQEDANAQKAAKTDIQNVQEQEAAPNPANGGWENNVSTAAPSKTKTGFKAGFKTIFKRSSPALGIGGVIGIGGLILLGLSSPSLLIIQLKETMFSRFNTQISSMEARTNTLIYSKMNGATSGFCNSKVSIKCKFTSMSKPQVDLLKDAGIEVEGRKTITGRTQPTAMKFNGKTIPARNFLSAAGTDENFRKALKQAYNPTAGGTSGKGWAAVAAKFKISKKAPEFNADQDPEAAKEKIHQISKEGTEDSGSRTRVTGDAPDCEEGCSGISEEEANRINSDALALENAAKNGSAAGDVRAKLSGINSSSALSFLRIDPFAYACQGYGALTALSYAGKAIRSAQLVRYSMIFLTVADQIKAGENPEPEDVELLGNIITSTVISSAGAVLVASGTDGFGYKYAAYGDSSASEKSMTIANRFVSGGGFVGQLSAVSSAVLAPLGGREAAKNTCGVLANPLVQGASLVLGVASLFVPGANVAKITASAATGAAVGIAISVLPGMLADIAAGTVTKDIIGEESVDAYASGTGALLSDALPAQNGNAPMSKADAIAYNSLQIETQNQNIADELRTTSPFDATNPHTFLGSIAAALIPLHSKSNLLTTIGSLFATSLGSIIPTSKAVSSAEYAKSLEVCTDLDVIEAGYAADPFCNMIRAIPPKYLNRDPEKEVATPLVNAGQITEDGAVVGGSEYAAFIEKCITNEHPVGYSNLDTGFDSDEAKSCIIDDDNANYYLYYMDETIDSGFDGYEASEGLEVAQSGSLPEGTAKELAEMITSSGNVTDGTGQLRQVISGSRTDINSTLLGVLAGLSSSHKFTISSMKRDSALSVGAGNKSLHLLGQAADISGSSGVNGVSFGYNGHNAKVQTFLDAAAAIMPDGCQIGVPNQAYVNATKPKAKPGCLVFVDRGSAPHIHLGVGSNP